MCAPWFQGFGDRLNQRGDDSFIETVDPTVDADLLAPLPGVLKDGGVGYVAGLCEHVEFTQAVDGCFGGEVVEFRTVRTAERADAG